MTETAKGSVPESGRGACFSEHAKIRPSALRHGVPAQADSIRHGVPAQADGIRHGVPAQADDTPDGVPTQTDGIPDGVPTEADGIPGTDGADTEPGGPARCPVCGQPSEGFGSFPIREGVLCGTCAGKLSEWFPCRPETTAAEIRAQLQYRQENRAAAGAFRTTKLLWTQPCAALDQLNGTFQISSQRGRSANPDILSFRQLRGCQTEIVEQRKELFRPGREHYRPRRYEYRFEIFVRVLVDHSFFREMRFRLHDRPIVVSDRLVQASTAGKMVKSPEYQRYRRAAAEICDALQKAMEQAREAERREAEAVGAVESAGGAETGREPENADEKSAPRDGETASGAADNGSPACPGDWETS